MRRLTSIFALVALLGSVPAVSWAEEEEEEATGSTRETLADRIPSVTSRFFLKRGRAELYPGIGYALNDPFYDHVAITVGVNYHIVEWLFVGISGDYYLSRLAPIAIWPVEPVLEGLNRPAYSVRGELGWAPLYGKTSLLAEAVVHFDLYVSLGGGMVGFSRGKSTFELTGSVGQRWFLADWFALKIDLRYQGFATKRLAGEEGKRGWESFLTASLGACFYLPLSFERETL